MIYRIMHIFDSGLVGSITCLSSTMYNTSGKVKVYYIQYMDPIVYVP